MLPRRVTCANFLFDASSSQHPQHRSVATKLAVSLVLYVLTDVSCVLMISPAQMGTSITHPYSVIKYTFRSNA